MTLEKLLEIVRQKRINANNEIIELWKTENGQLLAKLVGQRDAYLDIESLISFCIDEDED